MNIPTIRGTTCPGIEELAREFSIVIVTRREGFVSAGYIGRLTNEDAELGLVLLRDAFEYESMVTISGEGRQQRAGRSRRVFPPEGFGIDEIAVEPIAVIPLSKVPPRQLSALRDDLIVAWEGREHLKKHGAQVATATELPRPAQ